MSTRVVHRVRCRKKNDSRVWVDVKVVDAVTVVAPGGQEILYWTRAKDAVPYIVDKTGGGNDKGDQGSATRFSHMQLITGDDPQQMFYVEILDAFNFSPPPFHSPEQANNPASEPERHGLPARATFGTGPYGLICPPGKAQKYVVDKTGLNMGEGSDSSCSRAGHISIATEKGNTDDKTDGLAAMNDSTPPKKMSWAAVSKIDGINFAVPGGDIALLINAERQDEIDITHMTTDPESGEPAPPDNTDPNVYVAFPEGDKNGESIGANVGKAGGKGISQGPLWWIERVSPTFRPWFWYATVQEPQAFSFFAKPGSLGSWPWRGFVLWNNYPVIWILSRNNALVPMGSFGSPSLQLCAEKGDWDQSYPAVPSPPFLESVRPDTSTVKFPFTGLSLIPPELINFGVKPGPISFGPFGALPMTYPPLNKSVPGIPNTPYNKGRPNVWELTGTVQPSLLNPNKPFKLLPPGTPDFNPFKFPTARLAETVAHLFRSNWNSVANGHNGAIRALVGGGGPRPIYQTPPGWSWAIPFFDAAVPANRLAFQNGVPLGIGTSTIPLVAYSPATSWTLDVDQLDPAIWDATGLEYTTNPLNSALPIVLAPSKWPTH